MTVYDIQRWALLGQSIVFVVLCLVLPLLRLWWKEGAVGIVLPRRGQRGIERVVAVATLVVLLAYLAWAVLFWHFGPEALDVWTDATVLVAAGLALQLGGVAVVVVSQWQMGASWRIGIDDERRGLVRHGVYKRVRHPIYTGVLMVALATALLTPSPGGSLASGNSANGTVAFTWTANGQAVNRWQLINQAILDAGGLVPMLQRRFRQVNT